MIMKLSQSLVTSAMFLHSGSLADTKTKEVFICVAIYRATVLKLITLEHRDILVGKVESKLGKHPLLISKLKAENRIPPGVLISNDLKAPLRYDLKHPAYIKLRDEFLAEILAGIVREENKAEK